jgi:hypothetical protein
MNYTTTSFFKIGVGILLLTWLNSCSIINPEEEIPSYIRVDSISFSTQAGQGTASEKITDVWVYIDDNFQGAYELPATFPILAEGAHDLKIRGGIKMNGTSSTRAIYPFYNFYNTTVNLQRGQTTNVSPSVIYFPGTTFVWMEDFESPGISLDDATSAAFPNILRKTSTDPFEGQYAGKVHLNNDTFAFLARTSAYALPTDGRETYLEMNYKCDAALTVGVITPQNEFRPWTTINPSADWNKIYIRLTDVTSLQPLYPTYQVYFAMSKPAEQAEANLYLDNLKLLK